MSERYETIEIAVRRGYRELNVHGQWEWKEYVDIDYTFTDSHNMPRSVETIWNAINFFIKICRGHH